MPRRHSFAGDPALAARVVETLNKRTVSGLISVYLFGSASRGTMHRESDVDLGVYFDYCERPSREARFDGQIDLVRLLGPALRRSDLDVVVLNDAPPTLARHVLSSGQRIYCTDEAADHAFVRDTMLRAADLDPFLRRMRQITLAALAQ